MYELQGKILKEHRLNRKYSLAKVAKGINVSINYLSLLERGLRKPSDIILYSLSNFYNVNPVELFSLYDKVPTEQLNRIISSPSLARILTRLGTDERFTEQEKEEISEALEEYISQVLKRREEVKWWI